jgi:plastocyanin
MKRTILTLTACVALAAFVVPTVAQAITGPTASAAKVKKKTYKVGVYDYYFTKPKVTLKTGDKITWKWPDAGGSGHDVADTKRPKGAKKFHSPVYTAAVSWSHTFTKAGTYRIICRLHPDQMIMSVKVKKR